MGFFHFVKIFSIIFFFSLPTSRLSAMTWQQSSDYSRDENPTGDYAGRRGVWRYEYDTGEIRHRRLLRWDSSAGYWNCGKGTTTIISDTWMHPQVGANADLTWVAPGTKPVRIKISGAVKYPGNSGDGATVTVFHIHQSTVQKLWFRDLSHGQTALVNLTATVHRGDTVIFQVGAKQNNQNDRVDLDPVIETLDDAAPVKIEIKPDASGILATDSLQNVFPHIERNRILNGTLPSNLVDGGHRFSNFINLRHDKGPVYITWDLGNDQPTAKAQLRSLSIWMYAGEGGNYCGQLSVSRDGKTFQTLPGTLVGKVFPIRKNVKGLWSLNPENYDPNKPSNTVEHLIRYTFPPGQVKDFRYLRVESLGYKNSPCRIEEIDAEIVGVTLRKSTDIFSELQPLPANQGPVPLFADQTVYPPIVVRPVKFSGTKLVLDNNGKVLFDAGQILVSGSTSWTVTHQSLRDRELQATCKRPDGLERTCAMKIDQENRLTIDLGYSLPPGASRPVSFIGDSLKFLEQDVRFSGVNYTTAPVFVDRDKPSNVEIGSYTPYLIFPAQQDNIELQIFMPAWYNTMGRMTCFKEGCFTIWDLFAGADNSGEHPPDKWIPKATVIKPGENFRYRINIAVFTKSPRTLGQRDIEDSTDFQPLAWIETGSPDHHAYGRPTVTERSKMQFMGFKLHDPIKEKIGHHLHLWSTWNDDGLLERFARAGTGIVLFHSEWIDVSHGVSYQGDYNQAPPGFNDLLGKCKNLGMKTVMWFSPRGFLNQKWLNRPQDPVYREHPDWFYKQAHWFDRYQTLNPFREAGGEWVNNKFRHDLDTYSNLDGFMFDCFPLAGPVNGGHPQETVTAKEREWLRKYSQTIHRKKSGLLMANGGNPKYDDNPYYDYTCTENPLSMFVNEVTAGHSVGHSLTVYTRWDQLYYFWAVLGHMYYTFCDYDQALGFIGPTGAGLMRDDEAFKPIDSQIVPLWYLMGKGRRIYGAQIAPDIRHIEARMPDGAVRLIICSLSDHPQDVRFAPHHVEKKGYRIKTTIDTAVKHREDLLQVDLVNTAGLELKKVPPYSITVLQFTPLNKQE
jgi:hypothetical protein